MLMLWIQSRVDYTWNLPQILSKRQLSNNKHMQPFIILQRVWILQSLNTLGSTSSCIMGMTLAVIHGKAYTYSTLKLFSFSSVATSFFSLNHNFWVSSSFPCQWNPSMLFRASSALASLSPHPSDEFSAIEIKPKVENPYRLSNYIPIKV